MTKILHFFNILFLYTGCFVFFLFFMPSFSVKASDFTPHVNTGSLSYSSSGNGQIFAGDFSPYGIYVLHDTDNGVTSRKELLILAFNCDSDVSYTNNSVSAYPTVSSGSYYYDSHLVKWIYSYCSWYDWHNGNSYDFNISGTELLNYNQDLQSHAEDICNFFLFGVGSFDYVKPAEDIEDSDLDIVGLIGSVSDTYTGSDSFVSGLKSALNNFIRGLLDKVTNGASSSLSSTLGLDNVFKTKLGSINTVVPGCSLVWDSPEVYYLGDSDPITYNIWIDGRADLSLAVYGENYSSSCSFQKLNLHSGIISYNSASTFYYNTNTDYQVILDYILSHTDFGGNTSSSSFSQAVLNTTISRIYIQASKLDNNGDNHLGAISYVDFSSGYPVVFEGVTDTMNDIVPDSSGNGTTNTVNQPFVVSGDSIVYGDTITENNTTNNYYGDGLVIGGNIPFLNAAYWLIQAVLELIKTLYASLLVPFIVLGWTGHF